MSVNVNSNVDERLPMTDWPSDFQAQYRIALRRFRRELGQEIDAKKFLRSSSIQSHRDVWDVFLVAYPSAALVMKRTLQFFRQLEERYLPLELDEKTGELVTQKEADTDQLADPISYFQKERHQDNVRLNIWDMLLSGDVYSAAWLRHYNTAKRATETPGNRSKLRDDMRREMEGVTKPWLPVMKSAVEEIQRRFDQLEHYLSDFDELHRTYSNEHPRKSQQKCTSQTHFTLFCVARC
jgi:hypothetical protein